MKQKNDNISKNFSMSELTRTSSGLDNTPNEEQSNALIALVENVLQPLRDLYGKSIRVSSGFRSKELNKAVKGSKTSQHMNGEAADISGGSAEENEIIFNLISENLPFDQLIDEFGFSWIHVSFSSKKNRRQIFRATKKDGKTIYTRI